MTDRKKIPSQIILSGLVLLLVFFSLSFLKHHGASGVALGESAPNFTLTKDGGGAVSLADHQGKIVVLNFWASWCPPCIDELPSLKRFAERYSGKGVEVLGVSL